MSGLASLSAACTANAQDHAWRTGTVPPGTARPESQYALNSPDYKTLFFSSISSDRLRSDHITLCRFIMSLPTYPLIAISSGHHDFRLALTSAAERSPTVSSSRSISASAASGDVLAFLNQLPRPDYPPSGKFVGANRQRQKQHHLISHLSLSLSVCYAFSQRCRSEFPYSTVRNTRNPGQQQQRPATSIDVAPLPSPTPHTHIRTHAHTLKFDSRKESLDYTLRCIPWTTSQKASQSPCVATAAQVPYMHPLTRLPRQR